MRLILALAIITAGALAYLAVVLWQILAAAWREERASQLRDNPGHDNADPYLAKSARKSIAQSPGWVGEQVHGNAS